MDDTTTHLVKVAPTTPETPTVPSAPAASTPFRAVNSYEPHAPDRKSIQSMRCETFGQGGTSHVLTEVVGGVAAAGAATGMAAGGAFLIAVSPTEGGLSLPVGVGAIGASVPAAMQTWSGVVDPSASIFDGSKKVSPTENFIQKGLSGACKLVTRLTP